MQRPHRANSVWREYDGSQTGASIATRSSRGRQGLVGPSRTASCSSGFEGDVQEFGGGLSVFEALSQHPQGKGLHTGDSFITVCAVTHDAGQQRHFRQPTAVVFPLKFNRKRHARTVTSGPAVSQGAAPEEPCAGSFVLSCPSFVVMDVPTFVLVEVIVDAA